MTIPCVRCGAPAAAVMAFNYGEAQVWVEDLAETGPLGAAYALCEMHANRVSVPVGWSLTDERHPVRPLFVDRLAGRDVA